MSKSNQVYLQDMLGALERIEEYSSASGLEELIADHMRTDAIIRQLAVLGEAANRLSEEFLEMYPDFPAREAVAMRNFLVHDYDNVQIETVWQTLLTDLPSLKATIITITSAA